LDLGGPFTVALLVRLGFVADVDQVLERGPTVAGPVEEVQHHAVADGETRHERFGWGCDQAIESGLAPGDASRRRGLLTDLADLAVLRAAFRGLRLGFGVLDYMVGGQGYDRAHRVVAGTSGPAADLMELPRGEEPDLGAVVLGERGEKNCAYGHVDADTERVGAADDLEQPGLGQPFDEAAIAGKHSGVVHADSVAD